MTTPSSSGVKRKATMIALSPSSSDDESPLKKPRGTQETHLSDDDLDELERVPVSKRGPGSAGDGSNRNHEEDDDEALVMAQGPGHGHQIEIERGDDGFVVGSIFRVKVKNFMTYDHGEFHPGPHLNMIIGPNGTGKSTIAAAICLGLGWPVKYMARGDDIKGFVKQGTERAETEIELKNRRGKRNVIVWRRFNREDSKSEWKLNGEVCTKKAVTEAVQALGVFGGNLCSFLAQDKVSSFAQMDPIQLLKDTMAAAGDARLSSWHADLCEKGTKVKAIELRLEKDVEKRNLLQNTKDTLEPEVNLFNARKDQEFLREVLQVSILGAEQREIREQHTVATEERKALRLQIREQQEKRKPVMELQEYTERKAHKADASVKINDDKFRDVGRGWKRAGEQITKTEEAIREVQSELDVLVDRERRKEDNRKIERRKIEKAREVIARGEVDHEDALRTKLLEKKAINGKGRIAYQVLTDLNTKCGDNEKELAALKNNIDLRLRRKGEISDIELRRETEAGDFNPSIAFALRYIEEHKMDFHAEVCKPVMISANVKDKDFAWQIEMCTSVGQRSTFLTQNQHDYEMLLNLNGQMYPERVTASGQIRRSGEVRLHLAQLQITEANANPKPPCSREQLHALGFEGFAIDYVDAPNLVLAYLNQTCHLYAAALTRKPSSEISNDRVKAAGIRTWATRTEFTRATQSAYGSRAINEATHQPRPAKAFSLVVDNDAIKKISDEIADLKRRRKDMEGPTANLRAEAEAARSTAEGFKAQVDKLGIEISELEGAGIAFRKAQADIERSKRKLAQIDEGPSTAEERTRLSAKKLALAKTMLDPLQQYYNTCNEMVFTLGDAPNNAMFSSIQWAANRLAVDDFVKRGDGSMTILEDRMKECQDKIDRLKIRSNNKFEEMREDIKHRSGAVKVAVEQRNQLNEDPAALKAELAAVESELELGAAVNAGVIQRYEKTCRELAEIQETVDSQEKVQSSLQRKINRILDLFNPALDALIGIVAAGFSAALEKRKCRGDVQAARAEGGNYERWGIHIKVSFRDGAPLELLTANRQSGGERSLTTIMYLMSLTEMSRTPFSLVDEINQGMDPEAEQITHNQLVDTLCAASAGQYFLITPKLLEGLNYHRKMKVLIVNNGTWSKTQKFAERPIARLTPVVVPDHKTEFGKLKANLQRLKRQRRIAVA
ncbi:structural maintenance of chromosomes protein 5, partial [Tremellales sp. Uapishka_1]